MSSDDVEDTLEPVVNKTLGVYRNTLYSNTGSSSYNQLHKFLDR